MTYILKYKNVSSTEPLMPSSFLYCAALFFLYVENCDFRSKALCSHGYYTIQTARRLSSNSQAFTSSGHITNQSLQRKHKLPSKKKLASVVYAPESLLVRRSSFLTQLSCHLLVTLTLLILILELVLAFLVLTLLILILKLRLAFLILLLGRRATP
jgi:hypothetical protein